ncbi:16S rRNA (cytosine(1402)-N(4))-methyltransferase RsmH [Anaerosalibacter bizertensis]|uniref:Ribosomal RNA small subunit methyltransferase H n=1 Tax=Anaerosalibacter bizertensis TaxID=932217 RepID=A0A844FIJ4_9FIRM|nr:16S rRNA (cytosine(1402)-N(4))-methyltransferase RsmH [Anaerosalibacter bizertensis]MBV1817794.1 16S rRNA (cytosine(1402)-N(4))-methyltransferase RsmH [Bacteroidales bacterium MSK.15.36]HHV26843.1 16S rRNA (cytosine(1402)-N(4))-methyltransferase RsmH [Tissierellia bacterium]MBU5292713.1 16S rRNA (cytosine(1402)-N(4))-methyltransferase RsmH [Anaerosalibacter bizertensis]MCG4581394.1 16S rRNA (cytosine(1402)-N(4))-methyltransferase RsmH [Anaerosalibacter bizertensis]MSS43715.1 16S rRNA (cytos
MKFKHVPVMLNEVLEGLNIKEDGIYVDGTLGGAGHSTEIVKRLSTGKLIGIDQDENAIKKSKEVLADYSDRTIIVKENFKNIKNVLNTLGINKVDGILLDLGVSSHQLDEEERGFSYNKDAPLDMRMDRGNAFSAWDVVNKYSEKELEKIIWDFGEEKWAKRIAKFIVEERREAPIDTTFELVSVIKKAIPKKVRSQGGHPARKTFQAIRIEVNQELDILKNSILNANEVLNESGRLCIITFHSLEDRIVKDTFKYLNKDCICPPEFPVCTCNKKRELKILTRKPIIPSEEEIETNPRSRSAKLRIGEKV